MPKHNNASPKHRRRYRIFAKSIDYLIADVWANDDDEARRLSLETDGGNFRVMAGNWLIEEVRHLKDEDLEFESFQPLN